MVNQKQKKRGDICIIGGGPAALATLAAIHEPYTTNTMTPTHFSNANLSMRRNKGRQELGPLKKRYVLLILTIYGWLVGVRILRDKLIFCLGWW